VDAVKSKKPIQRAAKNARGPVQMAHGLKDWRRDAKLKKTQGGASQREAARKGDGEASAAGAALHNTAPLSCVNSDRQSKPENR